MILHSDERFLISFGEKTESFPATSLYNISDESALLATNPFNRAAHVMRLERGIVLKQTHGTTGYVIKSLGELVHFKPYANEGDYLITSLAGVGLAVATADCLPIIMYDPRAHAIGIVHAGSAGSFGGIATKMFDDFVNFFGTDPAHGFGGGSVGDFAGNSGGVRIFFGPSACSCCYEVQEDFLDRLAASGRDPLQKTICRREGKIYFDLPLFNRLILEEIGIPSDAFDMRYNKCTICTPTFCSYRREGAAAYRQMTIAALK